MPKIVYIAHPMRGDLKNNYTKVLDICKDVFNSGTLPFALFLFYMQYMNENLTEERELEIRIEGIPFNKEFFKRKTVDEFWVYGTRISEGMKNEMFCCFDNHIPVRCKNPQLLAELEKFAREYKSKNPNNGSIILLKD